MRSPWSLVASCLLVLALASAGELLAQPAIQINNINATEGNAGSADAVLTVSLTAAATGVVTVAFATEDNGATGGAACGGSADYVTESGTVQFNPGETSKPVGVAVCGDTADESNENVRVRLSNAVGATIQDQAGRVTIVDDDVAAAPSAISIGDATVVEGNNQGSQIPMTFPVTIAPAPGAPVTVAFATSVAPPVVQSPACGQGIDLRTAQGTLSFAPGTTSQSITVNICSDDAGETDEVFDLVLSNPTGGATLADGSGRGTITNDDFLEPRVEDQTITEGTGAPTQLLVNVLLSGPAPVPINAGFSMISIANGATVGLNCNSVNDAVAPAAAVSFLPGEASKTVEVTICSDALAESDEPFRVAVQRLSPFPPSAPDFAIITIRNDDIPVTLSINDVTFQEGSAVNAVLTASLSLPAPAAIQLTPSTAPHGTRIPRLVAATSGLVCGGPADFRALVAQFPIPAGATSVSIPVQICDDTVAEATEGLSVTIQPAAGLTIGDGVGIIRITDND